VIKTDDKRSARLNCIRHFLQQLPYEDKDEKLLRELIQRWCIRRLSRHSNAGRATKTDLLA
jgi:hypothetical protein